MSRIRSSGTAPESRLHEIVRGILGHRWRIDQNVSRLPGQPDLLVPSLSIAIFADGCFYHSCPTHGHIPKSNQTYWATKFQRTRTRDERNRRRLRRLGFAVWRVWEHDLKGRNTERTLQFLESRITHRRDIIKGNA